MTATADPRATHPGVASRRRAGLWLGVLLTVAMTSAACGGSPSSESASGSPDPHATITPGAPLTEAVEAGFDPPFTLRVPARWAAVQRDRSAFQAYAGNEDFEITFDHTHRSKESVAQAMTRLRQTAGLAPGPVTDVVIGDREGQGFVAGSEPAVRLALGPLARRILKSWCGNEDASHTSP